MNNLYDKIYEAINNGILEALVLEPDLLNSSIDWNRKKITAETNLIAQYANELLHGDAREKHLAYLELKKYTKKSNMSYKPTLDIFNQLVITIQLNQKGYKGINTKWADTSDFLSLILRNDQEISFEEYDEKIHANNVLFIRFKNAPCGHDIIICLEHLTYNCLIYRNLTERWTNNKIIYTSTDNCNLDTFDDTDCINKEKYGSESQAGQFALLDFDGYEHTYNNADIINNNRDKSQYPIFTLLSEINKNLPVSGYKAYLPAAGEMNFLLKYQILINYILFTLNMDRIFKKTDCFIYMTSSEQDFEWLWCINIYHQQQKITNCNKLNSSTYRRVMPFFKKIN